MLVGTRHSWFNHLLSQPLSGLGLAAPFRIYGVMMLIIAGLLFMGKHLYELKRMDNTVEKKQPATVHVYTK